MSSPLITMLGEKYGYPTIDESNFDQFIADNECVCLFLTEEPNRFPESNDVAVVLPELATAFAGEFVPAVVSRDYEKKLQRRYDFRVWPALVFLRNGKYLGTLTRILDWSDYKVEIPKILASEPKREPGVGIPVVSV